MRATVLYDPNIIQKFARQLYDRAFMVVLTYTVAGAVILVVPMLIGGAIKDHAVGAGEVMLAGLPGGLIGYLIGSQRAFWLKLQAQMALCQAQIELNLRNVAYVTGTPVQGPPGWPPSETPSARPASSP